MHIGPTVLYEERRSKPSGLSDEAFLDLILNFVVKLFGLFVCALKVHQGSRKLAIYTGLWPNNFDGSYPCTCTKDKFNMTAVQDLIPELLEYWPSYKCTGNNPQCDSSFWGHEYTKHGVSCV